MRIQVHVLINPTYRSNRYQAIDSSPFLFL
jgi:hypothetical protein